MNRPSYNWLYEYYLRSQCCGYLGEYNKKFFPQDYDRMFKEWQDIVEENKLDKCK